MRARAIMILGTSSHVGKLLLTAALCRIFALQALSGCSFKSQNMSLNSAANIEGLEIGRVQALQAEPLGPYESHPHQAVRRVIFTCRRERQDFGEE
jgi:adenosylcobyric acid synthase